MNLSRQKVVSVRKAFLSNLVSSLKYPKCANVLKTLNGPICSENENNMKTRSDPHLVGTFFLIYIRDS